MTTPTWLRTRSIPASTRRPWSEHRHRPEVVAGTRRDRDLTRSAEGAPIEAQDRHSTSDGPVRYTAPSVVFEQADGGRQEVGGFQPFEAYDTALANLDVSLNPRPPPPIPRSAQRLPERPDHCGDGRGSTTVRPRGGGPDGHRRAVLGLAGEGTLVCEPVGGTRASTSAVVDRSGAGRPVQALAHPRGRACGTG